MIMENDGSEFASKTRSKINFAHDKSNKMNKLAGIRQQQIWTRVKFVGAKESNKKKRGNKWWLWYLNDCSVNKNVCRDES